MSGHTNTENGASPVPRELGKNIPEEAKKANVLSEGEGSFIRRNLQQTYPFEEEIHKIYDNYNPVLLRKSTAASKFESQRNRSKSSELKVPQILNERRKSADMSVKLSLIPRPIPKKVQVENIYTQEEEKIRSNDRENAKDRDSFRKTTETDKKTSETAEISVFLKNPEILSQGLYAVGEALPVIANKKAKGNRKHRDKAKVVDGGSSDAHNKQADVKNQATEKDKLSTVYKQYQEKREIYESYRLDNIYFNGSNETPKDVSSAKNQNQDVFNTKGQTVLPPITGNAIRVRKRTSAMRLASQQDSTRSSINTATVTKLPPIETKASSSSGHSDSHDLLIRGGIHSVKPYTQGLSPICVAGTSLGKNERQLQTNIQTQHQGTTYRQESYCRRLRNVVLPPLTDIVAANKTPRGTITGPGQPLQPLVKTEHTIPPVHNMKLPPITGCAIPSKKNKKTTNRKALW